LLRLSLRTHEQTSEPISGDSAISKAKRGNPPGTCYHLRRKFPTVFGKEGTVFDTTNLRKAWQKACVAAGLGTLTEVDEKADPRYTGLIIHDLRRSAIKNLMKAGVNEKVAMKISGHKTRDVFDRYHIVDTEDVVEAMRRVQTVAPRRNSGLKNPVSNGEKIVKMLPSPRRKSL